MTDPTYDFQQQWEDMDPTIAHINKQAARIKELEAANRGLVRLSEEQSGMFDAAEYRAKTAEAKLERIVLRLEAIEQYGSDTLSGRTDGPDDWEWQRAAVLEMTQAARATLAQIKGGE